MQNDLSFITNAAGATLQDRFRTLIRDSVEFDALSAYFYTSAFHTLAPALQNTHRIRILVGIAADRATLAAAATPPHPSQETPDLPLSTAETKARIARQITRELDDSADTATVAQGIAQFIAWIKNGKLELRAYPTQNLHAKLYIMTFGPQDRDRGRVITGSSNFTQSGLRDNLEFNVELKNRADYDHARAQFDHLWEQSLDINEHYVATIQQKTWLCDTISPHHLYLKFLYEYFQQDLNLPTDDPTDAPLPRGYQRLGYQQQAVQNAKKILDAYNGVFLSDVVGLGKTAMAALLARRLSGRTIVIAPPILLEEGNPGGWTNVFYQFNLPLRAHSIGKLGDALAAPDYANVIIDEAHRFRNDDTESYPLLAQICRGKKVILVTATPYNNAPADILNLVKLFQPGKQSALPGVPDLDAYFGALQKTQDKHDRKSDYPGYLAAAQKNAADIREKILKHLMVRRTRTEITRYFAADLRAQNINFPQVAPPEPLYYQFTPKEDRIFTRTLHLITDQFTYARYAPLLHYRGGVLSAAEKQGQKNMWRFMKTLMVKRLESSFHAFRCTLDRFIVSTRQFIRDYDSGKVYIAAHYRAKLQELLAADDDAAIEKLLAADKITCYPASAFAPELKQNLDRDLQILQEIQSMWTAITRDPKRQELLRLLKSHPLLSTQPTVIFTESKETAAYLHAGLPPALSAQALLFTGDSPRAARQTVLDHFDARRTPAAAPPARLLISTEVLSEGINLHRANIVVNYDIPWNPTRMMQRVGRINRIDTTHAKLHTYNFFPTKQGNDAIRLEQAAQSKLHAFLGLLGGDAHLLTDGEPIDSHQLFTRLTSAATLTGETGEQDDATELKYLQTIRDLRDQDPTLFEKIKNLPKKARSAAPHPAPTADSPPQPDRLLTYLRRGALHKFYQTSPDSPPRELDFLAAAAQLECAPDTPRLPLPATIDDLLAQNKAAFAQAAPPPAQTPLPATKPPPRDPATQLLKLLKAAKTAPTLTDPQKQSLRQIRTALQTGALPKRTRAAALKAAENAAKNALQQKNVHNTPMSPMPAMLAAIIAAIPPTLLRPHLPQQDPTPPHREIILSLHHTTPKTP